jgi:hypothetical protein
MAMIAALALGAQGALVMTASEASACDRVEVEVDVDGSEVVVQNCWTTDVEVEVEVAPEPPPPVQVVEHREQQFQFQYAMQFLRQMPGHNLAGRFVSERDAYLSGELRYMPASDLLWVGRLGAGFDVFGRSDWDLTLGAFVGTAGEWDRQIDRAVLYAAPVAGFELGAGYEGHRLFGRYRLLAGLGGGPIDKALTENELSLGYKITRLIHAYGQYVILDPGEEEHSSGVGIGFRVAL